MDNRRTGTVLYAIFAAIFFGAGAPVSKVLLEQVEPIMLAALVYLGSGITLLVLRCVSVAFGRAKDCEAPLKLTDVQWLTAAVLAGGVAAPIFLMLSLRHTSAITASLLLNFEGAATVVIAALMFREATSRRIWAAVACITAASIVLSWSPGGKWEISLGALGVLAACLLWGFDNNFTRNISGKDPLSIVMVKGLCAGTFSLILALATGRSFPSPGIAAATMVFGSISYGLSIVFFILAMRGLGAARTSAFFGTAPFVGAALSLIIFRDASNLLFWLSVPLMILGAILLLGEKHSHMHVHEEFEHEHRHNHEGSHHDHPTCHSPLTGWHSHPHKHFPLTHSHPHTPDDHHRHLH